MKKIVKIGIILAIIVCAGAVTAVVKLNVIKPLSVVHMESTFEGINLGANTDKDRYTLGEDVKISGILSNPNTNDTVLYCSGYKNKETGELFNSNLITITVYTEYYESVWGVSNKPGKYDLGTNYTFTTYTIPIDSSSNFTKTVVWDQTTKNVTTGLYEQVTSGTYYIVVKLPVNWEHYYGESPIPFKTFGDSKKIVIE